MLDPDPDPFSGTQHQMIRIHFPSHCTDCRPNGNTLVYLNNANLPELGVELLYLEYLGGEDGVVEEVLLQAIDVHLVGDQQGRARCQIRNTNLKSKNIHCHS